RADGRAPGRAPRGPGHPGRATFPPEWGCTCPRRTALRAWASSRARARSRRPESRYGRHRSGLSPGSRGPRRAASASRDPPVEHVTAVPGEWSHLARPASLLDRLAPGVAHQDLGALDLVEGAVAWLAFDHDALALPSDRQGQLLSLEARHRDDARHREEVGHVLPVVDFVENCLLARLDVHGGAEEIAAGDGHGASFVR